MLSPPKLGMESHTWVFCCVVIWWLCAINIDWSVYNHLICEVNMRRFQFTEFNALPLCPGGYFVESWLQFSGLAFHRLSHCHDCRVVGETGCCTVQCKSDIWLAPARSLMVLQYLISFSSEYESPCFTRKWL